MSGHLDAIGREVQEVLGRIDEAETAALVEAIDRADRVFLAGAGRSGLMMRAFAMRLMHLGLQAYVVGETVTPAVGPGDLLVIGSGSGETSSLRAAAEKAGKLGTELALVTIVPASTIGKLADVVLQVPAPSPKAKPAGAGSEGSGSESLRGGAVASVQPMGSLFEQALLLLLDGVLLALMERRGADSAGMFTRHANLE